MQSSGEKQPINFVILTISLLAVCYNCILAFINHNITPLTPNAVVLCEVLLQIASFSYLLTKGIYEEDIAPLFYLLLTIVLTIFVMAINKQAYIDHLRNVMIIFAFSIMGRLANERTVKLTFKISCLIVLAVLICEIVSVKEYVALFHPAEYFQNTRGVPPATYSDLGLFRGALGFEGRFSFGLIDHRSSSIFLEQVSLANFCGVMVLYLISFSNRLKLFDRLLFLSTVILILLTNDTRTMLIFSLICVAGYFIYPWLPKALDLLTMPVIIVAGFVIHALKPTVTGDNFVGRINGTVKAFLGMDLQSTIGLQLDQVGIFFDSGYVYIIYGATIFGLILFWLYASLYPGGETVNQRRLGHALSLFLFLNLMIGSTAIFSMKTAGLVWLLVGFLKFHDGAQAKQPAKLALVATG
ncbi:hypothetical protein [Rhizobium sp. SYY.PMSO]|uniref:hypothetical protein n=1 Tax=Rhizobium sp. SYY.PMSO TaxID=3382192 RepID=UPI00398FF9F6